MFVVIDDRESVTRGYAAGFDREGVRFDRLLVEGISRLAGMRRRQRRDGDRRISPG